ncbi:MAG: MinD/ParA family protein [Pirellulaceae bacterium]
MMDQASELRKLVLRSMREKTAAAGPSPRLIVLAGGKGGVGVTTLAVNLSVGLAEQGARVVVVDADLYRSDVALLCGIAERSTVEDVLIARRDVHEVLQRGPAGIQIVPGLWAPGEAAECGEAAQERLLRQFQTLGPHADIIVLDVGNGSGDFVRRFCKAADDVLLVTTPDPMAVMDSYARIKTSMVDSKVPTLRLIVNQSASEGQAVDVHHRIDQSCERFLSVRVDYAGQVPTDELVVQAACAAHPFVLSSPTCPATQAVQQLAASLAAPSREVLTRPA